MQRDLVGNYRTNYQSSVRDGETTISPQNTMTATDIAGMVARANQFPEYIPSTYFDRIEGRFLWSHLQRSRRFWEYLIFAVSMITPLEITYVLIFDSHISVKSYSPFFFIDALQLIDNLVILITPLHHNGILISNKKEILKKYGIFSYIMHVFATLPLGWIGIIKNDPTLYVILSINRLLRLHQAYRSYRIINDSTLYTGSISQLFPHIIIVIFLVHMYACVFFLVAKLTDLEQSWIGEYVANGFTKPELYFTSIYFVLTTILTIGYGDIHPLTTPEVLVGIALIFSGVIVEASIIAKMVTTISDPFGDQFIAQYESLNEYVEFKQVDPKFHQQIKNYYQTIWERNHGAPSWNSLLAHIPRSIRNGIKLEFCERTFAGMPLFTGVSQKYMLMIMDKMTAFTVLPGDIITKQEEEDTDLLIFSHGVIQLILNYIPIATLNVDSGYVDGERQLIFGRPQDKTIRAVTYVDGWRLNRGAFVELVNKRRYLRRILLTNARARFPRDFINSVEWDDAMLLDGPDRDEPSESTVDEFMTESEDAIYIGDDSGESSDSEFTDADL